MRKPPLETYTVISGDCWGEELLTALLPTRRFFLNGRFVSFTELMDIDYMARVKAAKKAAKRSVGVVFQGKRAIANFPALPKRRGRKITKVRLYRAPRPWR